MYDLVKDLGVGKLLAVEGQIILIESNIADQLGSNVVEYLQQFWQIPPECNLIQIKGCMLRGNTHVDTDLVQCPNDVEIQLNESNFPPHMHHSSITDGAGIVSLKGGMTSEMTSLG